MMRALKLAALASAFLGFASTAEAIPIVFTATLDAAHEFNVADTSPGTGGAVITIDLVAHSMRVQVTFQNLFAISPINGAASGTTASHIHCCVSPPASAPVATTTPTFPGFPLGVTSGTYDVTFDMSLPGSWNGAATALLALNGGNTNAALAAMVAGAEAGQAYINIHTTAFPGGEIRGYLAVPEPSTLALFGAGLAGLTALRRRRKAQA